MFSLDYSWDFDSNVNDDNTFSSWQWLMRRAMRCDVLYPSSNQKATGSAREVVCVHAYKMVANKDREWERGG